MVIFRFANWKRLPEGMSPECCCDMHFFLPLPLLTSRFISWSPSLAKLKSYYCLYGDESKLGQDLDTKMYPTSKTEV